MGETHTTAVVQRYLEALAAETPADPLIRALLDRAVGRLEKLCGSMLFRSYLTQLQRHTDEVAASPGLWMPWNYRAAVT